MTEAFETFGGVPKVIVTDNMKTVMDEAEQNTFQGQLIISLLLKILVLRYNLVLQDVQIQRKNRSTNEAFR